MGMSPGITFWIIAWSMMGLAFVSAVTAILMGAYSLDQQSDLVDSVDE